MIIYLTCLRIYQTRIISITIRKIKSITLTELRLDRASKYTGAIAITTDNKLFLLTLFGCKKPKNTFTERKKMMKSKNKKTTERKILFLLGLKKDIKTKKPTINRPISTICCFVLSNILKS
jgi:CO dehydrogenase nickel-insertion accessory protein CooC1